MSMGTLLPPLFHAMAPEHEAEGIAYSRALVKAWLSRTIDKRAWALYVDDAPTRTGEVWAERLERLGNQAASAGVLPPPWAAAQVAGKPQPRLTEDGPGLADALVCISRAVRAIAILEGIEEPKAVTP